MDKRWQQIKKIFSKAIELDGGEREQFLRQSCKNDPGILQEVESLIRAHEAQGPLDQSIDEIKSTAISGWNQADRQGAIVGPYKIRKELGRGGMGNVYLAERVDEQFRQQVALKLLHTGFTNENQIRRFLAERQILASLNHDNIAGLLDGGITEHGQPWFAMEYVEGQSIDQFCNSRRLTVHQRLELFLNVCKTIGYAHRQLVVHRDLKPSNIMVKKDGTVKLLDFGIAKVLNRDDVNPEQAPVTKTGLLPLTPAYASPEQVKGEVVTTASDIYQLGMILYELLSGRRPYDVTGRTPSELEEIICEQEPTRPSTAITQHSENNTGSPATPVPEGAGHPSEPRLLQKKLRGDLDTIILKALRKEPGRRYSSAEQFAEDIERYLAGLPVTAHPDSHSYRIRKFIRRHKIGVASIAAFVLLLAGYAVTITWHSQRTHAALEQARQEAAKAEQVTGFLMGMFESGRPGEMPSDNITARELLDRGIEEANRLDDQPEIQAQMYEVVGRVNLSLGQFNKAESPLEKSLEIRKAHFGAHHPETARSLHHMGLYHHRTGDYKKADRLIREALDIRQSYFGNEDIAVASSLNSLADLLHSTGNYDEAETIYRQVLPLRRELLGEEHHDVNSTLYRLGNLLQDLGRYDEAEEKLKQSIELTKKLKGERHLDTASNMISLALLLRNQGKLSEAEQMNRQGLEIYREVLDEDHPYIAAAINNLAVILYDSEEYDQAIPLYYEALERYRAMLGNEHAGIATMIDNLGAAYSRSGNLRQAETLYSESLAMRLNLLEPEHPDVARSMNNLGSVLRRMGQLEESEHFLTQAIDIRRSKLGKNHPALARSMTHLARVYREQNKPGIAESLIREALAIRQAAYPDGHPEIAESLKLLGACLLDSENYNGAEKYLLKAFSMLKANADERPRFWKETLEQLVQLYRAWERPGQATEYQALLADL